MKRVLLAVALVGVLTTETRGQRYYTPPFRLPRGYYGSPYGGSLPYNPSGSYPTFQQLPDHRFYSTAPPHPMFYGTQGLYSPSPMRINKPSGYGIR